jgi:hypothetical protein
VLADAGKISFIHRFKWSERSEPSSSMHLCLCYADLLKKVVSNVAKMT